MGQHYFGPALLQASTTSAVAALLFIGGYACAALLKGCLIYAAVCYKLLCSQASLFIGCFIYRLLYLDEDMHVPLYVYGSLYAAAIFRCVYIDRSMKRRHIIIYIFTCVYI